MTNPSTPFRPGDIRGIYPHEINEEFVRNFAHAFCGKFGCRTIATGHDTRPSSAALYEALTSTLMNLGIEVVDMGTCPTEVGYFASACDGIDGALIITASHNPAAYNGIKGVLKHGQGIAASLNDIEALIRGGYRHGPGSGRLVSSTLVDRYCQHVSSCFDGLGFEGQVAVNGVCGTASTVAKQLGDQLDLNLSWMDKSLESAFDANPASADNLALMKSFMGKSEFALGIGWDGDCDRCEFFDSEGNNIPAYYIIGLFVSYFLQSAPGSSIVYDTRLCWNTLDLINRYNGIPVASQTGQAFMGNRMQESDAVYGGEISSHHYFASFFGCDSGMMTLLTMLKILSTTESPLPDLVNAQRTNVSCTPEISLVLIDADQAFNRISKIYSPKAIRTSAFDGLSFEMPGDWRFSLRQSRTEPLVRLNFECRGHPDGMLSGAEEVLALLQPFSDDTSQWPWPAKISLA